MQCPNCGSDIKPGSKFCVDCGFTLNDDIEDDNNSIMDGPDDSYEDYTFDDSSTNNKKRKSFDFKGNLTYIVLGSVFVLSIILLIYGLVGGNKTQPTPLETPVVEKKAEKITMKNFEVTVPAGYSNQTQGNNVINVYDDSAVEFSYALVSGSYEVYSTNVDAVKKQLTDRGYEIVSNEEKTVDNTEFLIFTLSSGSSVKYLYFTEGNSKYLVSGVISSSNINESCKVIIKMNDTLEIDDEDEDDEDSGSASDNSSSKSSNSGLTTVSSFRDIIDAILND